MMMDRLVRDFKDIFDVDDGIACFFAPGRINLIGEHLDYNGGYVFPAAISYGTYAVVRERDDGLFRFYSNNLPEQSVISCRLDELAYDQADDWANFPKGILYYLRENGAVFDQGFDVLYEGDIPNGAGLSSSASLEMVTGVMVNELYHLDKDMLDLVQLGKRVENEYIGVNSGIMDQFAIGFGKEDRVILLDCNTLEYEYARVDLEDYIIMIMHTNKQRALSESKYNERRSECEAALSDLQNVVSIEELCALSPEQFELHKSAISSDVARMRAEHAVYEHARTKEAFAKLNAGDLKAFGSLMNDSHRSLKVLYEVTGIELDTIVAAACEQEGVLGARMTGAGFGGCAIALVDKKHTASFKENVNKLYKAKIGYDAHFYEATIADGAKKLW